MKVIVHLAATACTCVCMCAFIVPSVRVCTAAVCTLLPCVCVCVLLPCVRVCVCVCTVAVCAHVCLYTAAVCAHGCLYTAAVCVCIEICADEIRPRFLAVYIHLFDRRTYIVAGDFLQHIYHTTNNNQ